MSIRTYSELSKLTTFQERFKYLTVGGNVGEMTFGGSRILNQDFYRSKEWKMIREFVILRDNGCDLGILDRPIHSRIVIHHMVPITKEGIRVRSDYLLNPEYMICVSHRTHNMIHYGSEEDFGFEYVPRKPNDTSPWR